MSRRVLVLSGAALFVLAVVGGYYGGLAGSPSEVSPNVRSSEELPSLAAFDSINLNKPQYMGRTTQTYTGSLGFITGANAKCQVDFPGSHMCTLGEMLRSGKTVFGNSGDSSLLFSWAACDLSHGNNTDCDTPFHSFDDLVSPSDVSCSAWNSNSSSLLGLTVRNDGWPSNSACSSSRSIHCCK